MPGGIVDAHAAQGADDDFIVLRQAQAGDFVVGDGVRIGVGVLIASFFAGGEVHAVQPVHRPDPYFIACAQESGGAVVLADEQVGQDFRLGEPLALDGPNLVEMAPQSDPHGPVLLHVAGLGHQVVVGDVALEGIHKEAATVGGESYAEKFVGGGEPDAALVIPAKRCRRMRTTPGHGHSGKFAQRSEGLQVHQLEPRRTRNPEPAIVVLATLADDVAHGLCPSLAGEGEEGISVVSDKPAAEGADPSVPPGIEVDAVDILVRKAVLTGESVHHQVILRTRLGA